MLLAALAGFLAMQTPPDIPRDEYGVPMISGSSNAEVWRKAGYAVAQDRLWQMDLSRHLAEGRLAELIGKDGVASDKEVLRTRYTDEELTEQIRGLTPPVQEAFAAYAQGVNDFIARDPLPLQYGAMNLRPEPWTELDSAAIAVRVFQLFGRGGAGAVRNYAAITYLESRKEVKGHVLDVADDFLWQNDPSSPTTVAREDEPRQRPGFPTVTRAVTERHLAMLPKLSLFQMLPAIMLTSRQVSTRVAERLSTPYRTGSYCMVVGAARSGSGSPILLSGPQMGFTNPSIVHQISVSSPDYRASGMDLPGVPYVAIGETPYGAWGLTSGVADTDDLVFYPKTGDGAYKFGDKMLNLESHVFTIHVRGGSDITLTQQRTLHGPVVLSTNARGEQPGYVFARHSSYRMQELKSLEALQALAGARTIKEADLAAQKGTTTFNVFFATKDGHIGYRYAGLVPVRSADLDPRLPVPGDPKYDWRGMIPSDLMPGVIDPKSGLLTNWNNKPISWWPNLDTPAWGRIFHVSEIRRVLEDKRQVSPQDLELAAWTIARRDETWPYFEPHVEKALAGQPALKRAIGGFGGWLLDGSRPAAVYESFIRRLRTQLFLPTAGNFMSADLFEIAAQPSVMLAALEGRTKFDYLQGRTAQSLVLKALTEAAAEVGTDVYHASGIEIPDQTPIPYRNRGSYIQIVELLPDAPLGRNIMPPGEAESGPHALDQVPLARAWLYKPMPKP